MEIYQDKTRTPAERAEDLLARMTLKEKVGQLAHPFRMFAEYRIEDGEILLSENFKTFVKEHGGIGTLFSLFRADPWSGRSYHNGITPNLREKAYNVAQRYVVEHSRFGLPALVEENAPHGLQVLGSTLYPTNLGIGATFDTDASRQMAACIAQECQNAGIHVPNSSLFDMACDPRFGRTEECFSEDPYLAAALAGSVVSGYKEKGSLICGKHYCAQGATNGGHNGGDAHIGDRELQEIHLPSVRSAVQNGIDFVMAAYNVVDGVLCHANAHLLQDILREEIGFNGVVRADRCGNDFEEDLVRAGATALNAGVMLGLGDTAFTLLSQAVEKGYTTEQQIDNAVLHILIKKFECGVVDDPYLPEDGRSVAYLESGVSREVAYRLAAESLVLLKNENGVLPLDNAPKIALFGEHANSIYPLLGDYTPPQRAGEMPTVWEALKAVHSETTYAKGWDFLGKADGFAEALELAEQVDVLVVCLGGSSARDFSGVYNERGQTLAVKNTFMDCGEGRDVCRLDLPGSQLAFLRELKKTGKPIVSVLIQGRPYLIDEVEALSDAVMIAWYPGHEGPRAIADALFGKLNCFGRLPVSIPAASSALPVAYNHRPFFGNYVDEECLSAYPFGSGLNYANVQYTDLTVPSVPTAAEIQNGAAVTVTVQAANHSDRAVSEVALLFIRARTGSIARRVRELKGFCRVELQPRQTKTLTFTLGKDELSIYGLQKQWIVEPTTLDLYVGGNPQTLLQETIHIQ